MESETIRQEPQINRDYIEASKGNNEPPILITQHPTHITLHRHLPLPQYPSNGHMSILMERAQRVFNNEGGIGSVVNIEQNPINLSLILVGGLDSPEDKLCEIFKEEGKRVKRALEVAMARRGIRVGPSEFEELIREELKKGLKELKK